MTKITIGKNMGLAKIGFTLLIMDRTVKQDYWKNILIKYVIFWMKNFLIKINQDIKKMTY